MADMPPGVPPPASCRPNRGHSGGLKEAELGCQRHRYQGNSLVTSVGFNASGLALQWRFRLWEPQLPSRQMNPSR
ncbi:hypothetical protein QTO34_000287 [Cnephaeus nilssonii]|uniref:Uncharacterized protein n=1 Tax=Cnephaeus nilssonii TaxID=3371016 RepID=A0AA40IC01_CNENI|nr:hypothetical protein QTO34_000287 [Eptesicus nilssonii]